MKEKWYGVISVYGGEVKKWTDKPYAVNGELKPSFGRKFESHDVLSLSPAVAAIYQDTDLDRVMEKVVEFTAKHNGRVVRLMTESEISKLLK
ncbi:MAG: hypothetical protein HY367_03245 [Candidatus Aenigmarchaeota archaeon]|nr:hypothetical protein [Candidatus Aenigmarchaeota archaeon]